MMNKNVLRNILGLAVCIAIIPVFAVNASGNEKIACVSKAQLFEVIEGVPKHFPMADNDHVYTVESNSNGSLTATIEGFSLTFFDSRDSDNRKWGTISNGYKNDGLNKSLDEVGCVTAGINNYETGKVDMSKNAVMNAQKKYNNLVKYTQSLIKK